MASARRRVHSKPLITLALCSAFVFLTPKVVLLTDKVWLTNAVFASNNANTSSELVAGCADEDSQYVQIHSEGRRPTSVSSRAYKTTFDAMGNIWTHGNPSIVIRAINELCWDGGVVSGNSASNVSNAARSVGRSRAAAMQILGYNQSSEVRINRIIFVDVENAIDVQGTLTNVTIAASWFYNISQHCIGGAAYQSWTIENSLLDGCGTIAQPSVSQTETRQEPVLTIQNNVIRIGTGQRSTNARRSVYESDADDIRNLTLEVHGNVFLIEDDDASSFFEWLRMQNVKECSDNVIVWLWQGEQPNWLPDCFSITYDRNVWERARAAWINNHQLLEQFEAALGELGEAMGSQRWHLQGHVRSEVGSNAQRSVHSGSGTDDALAALGPSTPQTVTVPPRPGSTVIEATWSDQTLWTDDTGWAEIRRR